MSFLACLDAIQKGPEISVTHVGSDSVAHLVAFALASAALIAIPGPSVLFVVGRSLALGRRGGLLTVVGNAAGVLVQVVAVALGVGAIVAQSIVVFSIVKFAGAAYLIFLGIQAIRHRKRAAQSVATGPRWTVRILGEGFLTGVSNPKTVVFFIAVLPQFVDYDRGSITVQLAELGAIFVGLALVMDSTWALAAGTARDWFARSPRRLEHLSTAGGVMMIGLGGVVATLGGTSK